MRTFRSPVVIVVVAGTVIAATPTPASAYPRPGRTERASVASAGDEGLSHATAPSISENGRYVAFHTLAPLASEDTNDATDVYVRDRVTGTTERISVGADGRQSDADSGFPRISRTGRYVAFLTQASNLVDVATEGSDVVIKDRQTGAIEPVSVTSSGTPVDDGFIRLSDVSADGRYVLFESWSADVVPNDTNGTADVFLRDRKDDLTERISLDDGGTELFQGGHDATMTDDARLVAFTAIVTSPPVQDTDASDQVQLFVRDRGAGTTSLVSAAPDGDMPNGHSHSPQISSDGSKLAFSSNASNLVPADANRLTDIFVRDLTTGEIQRVSVDSAGQESNGRGVSPAISGDGRIVAWESTASNLVPEDGVRCILRNPPPGITEPGARHSCQDIFVHDTLTGITELASVGDAGPGDAVSASAVLDGDGSHVAFISEAANLVGGDGNGVDDIFVRHRGPALGIGAATAAPAIGGDTAVSGWSTFSGVNVAASADAPADTTGVAAMGTEITAARVVYRHEERSLLAVISLAELPGTAPPNVFPTAALCPFVHGCPPGVAPGAVVHGVTFEARGVRWYISTSPSVEYPPDPDGSTEPGFTLHRCPAENVCYPAAQVRGGYGTTGNQVRISAPLNVIGLGPADELTAVRAFAGVGEPTLGFQDLDSLELGTTDIPAATVELGVGAPEGPDHAGRATLSGGRFEGLVRTGGLPASDRRTWVRACLDSVCSRWTGSDAATA